MLEWLYFPAISLILRWQAILSPFFRDQRQNERSPVLIVLAIRGLGFGLLGYLSVKALLLYFLSYIGYITIERMMDAFQHTYDVFPAEDSLPKRDYAYEQANTFSSLFPKSIAWFNLLLLNFGYHNAHHELISCPWYHLPQLQKDLAQKRVVNCINPLQLLANYHRFRIQRIFLGQGKAVNFQGEFDFDQFYGAIDVSIIVQY
jgi:fatty acid desaturase